jgi:hypothetical protein
VIDYNKLITADPEVVRNELSKLPENELMSVLLVLDAYEDYLRNIDQVVLH